MGAKHKFDYFDALSGREVWIVSAQEQVLGVKHSGAKHSRLVLGVPDPAASLQRIQTVLEQAR